MGYGTSGAPSPGQTATDDHFLNRGVRGYASNEGERGARAPVDPGRSPLCHFFVFLADSVSVTSTQFSGGDWHWRLSDPNGAILVEAGGYRSEAHCREAVALLQACAARAAVI